MSKGSSQTRYSTEDMSQSSYVPRTTSKSVIISRSSTGPRSSRISYGGGGGFGGGQGRLAMNPSVYSQVSATGISEFRGTREKEKKEMQDCNERLATYIEKVRWLEAKNKQLEAEVEALRNRKQEDWKPIRDMYEGELDQARKVIAELSSQKGVSEGKLAGLQDEIVSLRELIAVYDTNAKDYAKKIDQLNSQIGEYEGEVTNLRLRCGSLEDEVAKLRALLQKYKDENMRIRSDLDAETAAHIEQEVLAQTKAEEVEFLQDVLDKLQTMQQEPVMVKGLDMEQFFKGELRQAIASIQQMYDERLESMSIDLDARYSAQMNQLRSGNVRDNMESEHAKSEIKRLKDQLAERSAKCSELEMMFASMKAERDALQRELRELRDEFDRERADSARQLQELQLQIEALMQQLSELIDAKMSLELEIACYKKLLEGEENRTGLRTLVEQTIGSQSRGGASLSNIIGQSNMNSSTTAKTTIQRSSKGPIGFKTVDAQGSHVTLENTTSGPRAKIQNLRGWKIAKYGGNYANMSKEEQKRQTPVCSVDLGDRDIGGGQQIEYWAKGALGSPPYADNVVDCKFFSWGSGNAVFELQDQDGNVKASLTVTTA